MRTTLSPIVTLAQSSINVDIADADQEYNNYNYNKIHLQEKC